MNDEFNNQSSQSNIDNNNLNNNFTNLQDNLNEIVIEDVSTNNNIQTNSVNANINIQNNNKKRIVVIVLAIILLILIVSILFFVINKKNNLSDNINNNEQQENNNNIVDVEFLSLKDFPIKDDDPENNKYIKFKGKLSALNGSFNEKKGIYEASYKDIKFTLECVDSSRVCENFIEGNEICSSASLKLNDKIVYKTSDERVFPYIIITNEYIIIRSEDKSFYNVSDNSNNIDHLGNIYIYDLKFEKVMEIDNVNTLNMIYYMENTNFILYERLNSSLDIAIKDNVLYYVIAEGTKRVLKYVNLNENELKETIVESFEKQTEITRNTDITSISQFPIKNEKLPEKINGYYLKNDNISSTLIIKDSTNKTIKTIEYVWWYVNPNGFVYDSLNLNSALGIKNNIIYYLVDNKDETLSLKSIDFSLKEIEENTIDTFKKYNNTPNYYDELIVGKSDCSHKGE